MALGWIDPHDYSFNSFLLLERFQVRLMLLEGGWHNDKTEWRRSMGVALTANPVVAWYLKQRCPECAGLVDTLLADAPSNPTDIRKAEEYCLASVEDFVIYTTPDRMAGQCEFIREWNPTRLFELVDFSDKTVLDVGAGSGRLTFAAATVAAKVYASEPVGTLREFMRDKITTEGITNVQVLDGLITDLPFPDNTFDVVMSGHVVGDDWDEEVAELTRVCKPGGWLIDCRGDSPGDAPSPELLERGWEEVSYTGSFGSLMHNYRKRVVKQIP